MIEQDERDHWVRAGHAMFAEFMQRVQTIDRIGVKGMDASTENNRVTLLDKRKVYASLDEIADLYVSDEKKMVLDFTESRALAVFHSPTPQHPMEYIGFRWSYYKTPSRLVRSQDFFYLETMKPFVDVYGRRGWAKCSHSIEHPMCPDNSTSRGINRGRLFYSGVVFIESREKGVLETTFYYSLDTTSIPAFLLPVVMKQRGKNNAALINHYVKVARMSAYAEKTNVKKLKQQLVEEKRCGACSNPMPKWTSKTKCLFCKSYVCKRCVEIVSKNYLFDGEAHCNSCMLCAESHGTKITSLMDDDESSDETESRGVADSNTSTPSSVDSANRFHHAAAYGAKPRLDRCMSAPGSAIRLPPKLVDFGLDGIDFALRKHEAPAAAARAAHHSASTASPSEATPAPTQTRPPASVSSSSSYPPSSSANQNERPARQRRVSSRRHHIDSPHDRSHGVPAAPTPSLLRHQRLRHQHLRHSDDEPTPLRKEKAIVYTRENPCDLSYLSAFKV